MTEKLDTHILVYESPFVEIKTAEEAQCEAAFLRKAFSLKMFNEIVYENPVGADFLHHPTSEKDIEWATNRIIDDAQAGKLPSRYYLAYQKRVQR